jgi:hypothetical protein
VRAIETMDQSWRCRLGLTELDSHPTLSDALIHLRAVGEIEADGMPFEIVAHPLLGPPQFFRGEAIAHIGSP